jgi:hypothetical protein
MNGERTMRGYDVAIPFGRWGLVGIGLGVALLFQAVVTLLGLFLPSR